MIQTIIFDVGEVLLEYRWLEMLTDYGLSEADASVIGKTIFADPLWDELDLGIRSRTDIIQDFEQKYPQYKKEISWFLNHGEYMHVPTARRWIWKWNKIK